VSRRVVTPVFNFRQRYTLRRGPYLVVLPALKFCFNSSLTTVLKSRSATAEAAAAVPSDLMSDAARRKPPGVHVLLLQLRSRACQSADIDIQLGTVAPSSIDPMLQQALCSLLDLGGYCRVCDVASAVREACVRSILRIAARRSTRASSLYAAY